MAQNKWQIEKLKNWDKNPRGIRADKMEDLKKELGLGQHQLLLITSDGTVLGGNMRLRAMQELGWKEVEVKILDHKKDDEGYYAILDGEVVKNGEGKIEKHWVSVEEMWLEYSLSHNNRAGFYVEDKLRLLFSEAKTVDPSLYSADVDSAQSIAQMLQGLEKSVKDKPEIEFAIELGESHNYVVLYFDNDIDWLFLQSLYPLKSVKALDSKPGFEKIGIGRVVKGVDFINAIKKP